MKTQILPTKRMTIFINEVRTSTMLGEADMIVFTALAKDEPIPCMVHVSGLFLTVCGKWVLQHILVEDELRRNGYGTEIIFAFEKMLGSFGACWATDYGKAFGAAFMKKHGPRRGWSIGLAPHLERAIDDAISALPRKMVRSGEPCGHPGCLSHLSHPCEGCRRVGGRGDVAVLMMENPLRK